MKLVRAGRRGRVVTARYWGQCAECEMVIRPGQWIQADGFGSWIHARHHGWKALFGLFMLVMTFLIVCVALQG